ncbi:MAG: hypothetical protein ACKOPS_19115, partial [Cyanobium sp.]
RMRARALADSLTATYLGANGWLLSFDGLQQSERRLSASTASRQPLPLGALLQSSLRIAPTALALAWAFRALGRWRFSSGGPRPTADKAYLKAISAGKP